MQGAQPAPPLKIPEGDSWLGAYVRLMTGLFIGKLGRVASCSPNGTSCGVYILRYVRIAVL